MTYYYIVSNRNGLESFIHREISLKIKNNNDVIILSLFKSKDKIFTTNNIKVFTAFSIIGFFRFLKNIFILIFYLEFWKTIFQLVVLSKKHFLFELYAAVSFFSVIRDKDNSSIQCHFGDKKFFIGGFLKKWISDIKLFLTVHAHELYANPNMDLFKYFLEEADKIVTISKKNEKLLFQLKTDLVKNKVKTIRLTIDLEQFKKKDMIKILTIARYTERKGFRELFSAIKNLKNIDDVEFITIGWGDLDLDKLSSEYGVADRVTVFSKMSPKQIHFFYNNCDIFCLPSKFTKDEGSEGVPVVLMEAMANEMIIVSTPNGSIPELVDEILVEEANVTSLTEGLIKAIDICRKEDKIRLSVKNRNRVLDLHSNQNFIELLDFWNEN